MVGGLLTNDEEKHLRSMHAIRLHHDKKYPVADLYESLVRAAREFVEHGLRAPGWESPRSALGLDPAGNSEGHEATVGLTSATSTRVVLPREEICECPGTCTR
jgi:hypothetical protein